MQQQATPTRLAAAGVRAAVLTVVHVVVSTSVTLARATVPDRADTAGAVGLAVVVGAAVLAGGLDGWWRTPDTVGTWLIAGLVTGPCAGVLALLVRGLLIDRSGLSDLGDALVGGAAFTALLVLLPALVGVAAGRRLEPVGRLRRS